MREINLSSNPELKKLKEAINNIIIEIKNYAPYSTDVPILLLLIIVLKRDGLLILFRNYIAHSSTKISSNDFKEISLHQKKAYQNIFKDYISQHRLINILAIEKANLILDEVDFEKINKKEFINVFESILIMFFANQRSFGDTPFISKEISDLIYKIEKRANISVYNPFSGMGTLSLNNNSLDYYGQEISKESYLIHCLRILAHNQENNSKTENINPVFNFDKSDKKYDLIVSNPPIQKIQENLNKDSIYGNIQSYEQFFFINAINKLNNTGKIIALIPQGFLYFDGVNKQIRKEWIKNDLLDLVIQLPTRKVILNTGMQYYLIVLDNQKQKKGEVKFIDARNIGNKNSYDKNKISAEDIYSLVTLNTDSDLVRVVTTKQIEDNDFILTTNKYFAKTYSGKPLSEFCTVVAGRRSQIGEIGKFVQIRDLKSGMLDYNITSDDLEIGAVKYGKEIKENCLLLAIRGTNLKPTIFNYTNESIFISNNIIALKINENIVDIKYLIKELESDYVKEQVNLLQVTEGIPSINKEGLLSIVIDTKDTIENQRHIADKIESSIEKEKIREKELLDYIEKIKKDTNDELRVKKHTIMQFMNNIILSLDILKNQMEKSNGVMNSSTVINNNTGTTIQMQFDKLIESSRSVFYQIDNLTNEISFEKKEDLDINLLIQDSIKQGSEKMDVFETEYIYDIESFKIHLSDDTQDLFIDPISFISRSDFYIVYNNIIENAFRHGFSKKEKKYKFRIELRNSKGNGFSETLTIIFSNNGKPFPKGMSDSYCIKGEKAGSESNDGIGSWKVCEIVKNHFNGTLNIIDNPGDEFPVKIEISIPITGFE